MSTLWLYQVLLFNFTPSSSMHLPEATETKHPNMILIWTQNSCISEPHIITDCGRMFKKKFYWTDPRQSIFTSDTPPWKNLVFIFTRKKRDFVAKLGKQSKGGVNRLDWLFENLNRAHLGAFKKNSSEHFPIIQFQLFCKTEWSQGHQLHIMS